ncbi:hypothetical protein V8C86DRAFT_1754301 [Haematococcus lacustris]
MVTSGCSMAMTWLTVMAAQLQQGLRSSQVLQPDDFRAGLSSRQPCRWHGNQPLILVDKCNAGQGTMAQVQCRPTVVVFLHVCFGAVTLCVTRMVEARDNIGIRLPQPVSRLSSANWQCLT